MRAVCTREWEEKCDHRGAPAWCLGCWFRKSNHLMNQCSVSSLQHSIYTHTVLTPNHINKWLGRGNPPCFPCSSVGKESACSVGDPGSIPGLGRSPGEGNGNPLQYPWPRKFYGQRSLVGCSPWDRKEMGMTEWLTHNIQILPAGSIGKKVLQLPPTWFNYSDSHQMFYFS